MVWYGVYSFNISVHFYIAHITQDAEREMHEVRNHTVLIAANQGF